jgi:hypothetical protein
MQSNRYQPTNTGLDTCLWCNEPLGQRQSLMPRSKAQYFCSRLCEIEASFWLFQELCAIEITHPPASLEGPSDQAPLG